MNIFLGRDTSEKSIKYAKAARELIDRLAAQHPMGWLVDLRGNLGGNMWPMLLGIGPVLGEGEKLGGFFISGRRSWWRYRQGEVSLIDESGKKEMQMRSATQTSATIPGSESVAVLTDKATASSGEAIAIAFKGRKGVRFFGQPTFGVPTVNEGKVLADGANLLLTVGVDEDRLGRNYEDSIAPDEVVPEADRIVSFDGDPVVQAALRWLAQ